MMRYSLTILLLCLSPFSFAQETPEILTELACESCHVVGDWLLDAGVSFNHVDTGFELEGTHGDIMCTQCHVGSTAFEKHNFGNIQNECSGCHNDIHGDQWGQDCQRCHTPESWTLSTQQQNHDLTRFPLLGPHRILACESCHLDNPGTHTTLAVDCWGCHESNFTASRNPDHRLMELDYDCELCHSNNSSSWTAELFNHDNTHFPLLGMHREATCEACHSGPATNAVTKCESCHLQDYSSSLDPAHAEEGYPQDCRDCHDSFTWNSNFTHDQTGFFLNGAHVETSCNECHENQSFDDTEEDCGVCHLEAWQSSEIPPHEAAEFEKDCETCHTEVAWTPSSWDHDTETDYLIDGAHLEASCEACHISTPYSEQVSDCYACHQLDYENTLEPNHITSGIPTTCDVCHTTTDWSSEGIDHDQTLFPLEGAHTEVLCENCHADGYDLPILCEGCHLPDYQGTVSGPAPDHEQFGFSQDCLQCHNQVVWTPSSFDHNPTTTGYALQGEHQNLLPDDCFACHEEAQWTGISNLCEGCHQSNFNESENPDHLLNGFPENLCESCHTPSGWNPSIFDHATTTETCATCHLVQHSGTTNPNHDDAAFGNTCQDCHVSNSWTEVTWDHGLETDFNPLGAHLVLACTACHTSAPYSNLISECSSCHQSDFDATTEPDHEVNGYPSTLCESCHSQAAWTPSIYDHLENSEDCASCHMTEFTATTDPPHESLAYSQDCIICHTSDAWSPSSFVHDVETTGFLKDGAHNVIGCNSCHATWDPPSEVRSCASSSCHLDDYQESSNPPHETMSFSDNCTDCHTTTAWLPSQFEHSQQNTGFLLEEAHTPVECQQCHSSWQIIPDPRTCGDASCHLPDYQSASDPDHASASFPLECETCHSMTAWEPSTFDHDGEYFPIYSGQHRGEWNDCSQCHINTTDYSEFTCFGNGCHSITEMNDEHCDGADCESCNGITYPQNGVTPLDCYTCHPTGDEDDCDGRFLNFFQLKILPQPDEKAPNETR